MIETFSQYFKVLRAGKYLSNQQFRSDQKRTLNHVLNPWMKEWSSKHESNIWSRFLGYRPVAHLKTKASRLDVMIGRPGIELSPAK